MKHYSSAIWDFMGIIFLIVYWYYRLNVLIGHVDVDDCIFLRWDSYTGVVALYIYNV